MYTFIVYEGILKNISRRTLFPDNPHRHRWLTLDEVRRLMGVPDHYELGSAKTVAGEVLGQGVEVATFTRLIQSVTRKGVSHVA